MKKLTSLLLALIMLFTALTLSGCGTWPAYEPGYQYKLSDMDYEYALGGQIRWHHANYSYLNFIATSDTTTFNKDNVTFNIGYSTHQSQVDDPKSMYYRGISCDHVYFAIYIHDGKDGLPANQEQFRNKLYFNTPEEFSKTEGITVVKGINEEEAFSKEYSLLITPFFISNGSVYQHVEEITIPREYVEQTEGSFMIEFSCFQYLNGIESQSYVPYTTLTIKFDYYKIDENTIEIRFNKMHFWNNEL
ncbi:MAG: hypothetical protein IJ360_02345 [Clostridia bacterium]|nr:hypothetical protein [Clostridia bacterium]